MLLKIHNGVINIFGSENR